LEDDLAVIVKATVIKHNNKVVDR